MAGQTLPLTTSFTNSGDANTSIMYSGARRWSIVAIVEEILRRGVGRTSPVAIRPFRRFVGSVEG